MRNTWIFYRKEMLEMLRGYKLLWIPVVFMILGIMQPISAYYMPEILKMSGDVPPGLLESYTLPGAAEVMAKSLGQYGVIGLLVLALSAMNSFAGEREGGTAELVLARPLTPLAAASAKWLAQLTLLVLSLGLGAAGAGYYITLLIGPLPWSAAVSASALYGLWLMCAVSLTLLFSACLRAPAAAFLSLAAAGGLALLHTLLPRPLRWSPAALPKLSAEALLRQEYTSYAWVFPVLSGIALIVLCFLGASLLFDRNKLPRF
ncbi:ABC-2 type transport system permease protein [Paenibacillus forsythiae]|uniref:ABC-2 type transport system permease protein n=1 Tax=Paenibacillus forsythiae TaxID=365616 RepID=A0ABU3H9Q5_9BACL|nr:ABC transporter permease subunit [Paenibacillus forsythiae]MDT3427558.1 ABC-2 type transport system permease protein [Paenibacillus forsythiae]